MTEPSVHHFGIVDDTGDFFDFHWEGKADSTCLLEQIAQTERGPRRSGVAEIPLKVWDLVCGRVVRELREGMGTTERLKRSPTIKKGITRLSPLIGRELAILLWALMETGETESVEPILHSWRELAREERWWLYARASAPGQRVGSGWRRALFHALSETPESRVSGLQQHKAKPLPQPMVREEGPHELGPASDELSGADAPIGNVVIADTSNNSRIRTTAKSAVQTGAKKVRKRLRDADPKQEKLF